MNAIDKAVELMENGWCISDLKQTEIPNEAINTGQDRYCAVGAVAEALGIMAYTTTGTNFMEGSNKEDFAKLGTSTWVYVDESVTYANFDKTTEARCLAIEVLLSDWYGQNANEAVKANLAISMIERNFSEIVFYFNDENSDKQVVIDLFKKASKRFNIENY